MSLEQDKEVVVINAFLTEKENTVPKIAEKTGLLESTIHKIINKYLAKKVIG